MVRKLVVLMNWSSWGADKLCPFVRNIIVKMTGNTNFGSAPVTFAVLEAAINRAELAYGNRKNGALARVELKAAMADLISLLVQIANYVSTAAYGDAAKIISAGFQTTKDSRTKAAVPSTPEAPKLSSSNGTLNMLIKKVNGSESYCWAVFLGEPQPISISNMQLNVSAVTNMVLVPAGTTRACVRGIAPGTKVSVQVLAQNTAGKSAFSPAVAIYVNH